MITKRQKQIRETTLSELVETHNLANSLRRLCGPTYDGERWKRALYHALAMTSISNRQTLEKIRVALELP